MFEYITNISDTFSSNANSVIFNNLWFWIAILEFIIIILLLFKLKKRVYKHNTKMKYKKEAMKENVDFDNIFNSSFNSRQLYDQLKVKCHPDRFSTDSEKETIADSLFQEITKNKTNYKKLIELKEYAIEKLNINF